MNMKTLENFRATLRACLQASGLAQWEVARKVGIHASEMSRYVAGRKIPTWPRALALLRATGAEVAVFQPGEQDSGPSELARFRQWAEENHAGGYSDMVWEEWEKYHSGRH